MTDRARIIDAAAIVVAKVVVALAALHFGFTHVSDDDYARTVISERFAHAPVWDPSGTSWLPFPFWLTGTAMIAFGRSLEVARNVAMMTSAFACAAAFLALRSSNVARVTSLLVTLLAMALPWIAWTGATNVPEGFVPPLLLIGMLTANGAKLRIRGLGAIALLVASLSRYEAWPICAVFFLSGLAAPITTKRTLVHAIPLVGPAGWMLWNLHAHGSATHFLARVAAYRDAIGASDTSALEPILVHAKALLAIGFEPIFLGCFGLIVFYMRRDLRQRWAPPLFACVTMTAFLIYGESRGGAPTHHPERAMLAVAWVLLGVGIDALSAVTSRWTRATSIAAPVAAALWMVTLPARYADAPGTSPNEDRMPQISRGLDLRARNVPHLIVVPCAYEHFALIAAFGAPEKVDVALISPREALAHTSDSTCPRVAEN